MDYVLFVCVNLRSLYQENMTHVFNVLRVKNPVVFVLDSGGLLKKLLEVY